VPRTPTPAPTPAPERPAPPSPSAATTHGDLPPSVLLGLFALLLVVVFAVAYGVGGAAGPVNPGLHPARSGVPGGGGGGSAGGGDGMGGMG
jgi:hypothetical protein